MTDKMPSTNSTGPRWRRTRWLVAVVALVALAAGGSGALAATIAHRGDSSTSPTPGPSVYIPYAGQQGSGASSAGGAAPQAAALAPGGAASSYGSATYPYPGYGVCTGSDGAQVSGQVVTATGTSTIGGAQVSLSYALYAWINSQGSGDVSRAISDVQQRMAAVVGALAAAGVDRGSIKTSSVNVYASGGKNGIAVPAAGVGQIAATVNASASLTAALPGASVIDKAVSAAAGAGADSVNVSTQYGSIGVPTTDALSAALAQASDQAHRLAQAAAKATGVTLGAVRSVSAQQPTVCGYGADGPQLVVGVTVAYALV